LYFDEIGDGNSGGNLRKANPFPLDLVGHRRFS
jgi:hypothetical protein